MGLILSSLKNGVCDAPVESPAPIGGYNSLQFLTQKFSTSFLQLHVMLLSLLFFTLVFITINAISHFTETFKRLLPAVEVFWCRSIVSVIFSILHSPITMWLVLIDDYLRNDIVNNTSITSTILLGVGIGFSLYEIIIQLTAYALFQYWDFYLLLHNLVNFLSATLIVYFNQGHFIGCVSLLVSVPIALRSLSRIFKEIQPNRVYAIYTIQLASIYMNIYSSLLGVYCLSLLVSQWDIVESDLSVGILFIALPNILMEVFVISTRWSYSSMEELFYSTCSRKKSLIASSTELVPSSVACTCITSISEDRTTTLYNYE